MSKHGLTPPKAVIFDWDNTLVDSWGCILAAMNGTLRRMGHGEWSLDEAKDRVALSLRDSFPKLFGERWIEARDVFYEEFAAIHLEHLNPLPGAGDMLERLVGRGVVLSVVSNKNGHFLRQEAERLGWAKWFHRLVGATDAAQDKPAVAPVTLALSGSGVETGAHVWFCGDAEVDMHCAANSGCVPILLREDQPRPGEFDRHRPFVHVDGCYKLADLADELLVPISLI
ncbi:MAG TPA: HAD family hydrolase [Candidatus Sulfotelmatobacter sp.]|jgi:phosphoglycolate phosphatase|nr:HAD family hydrolase [Candidatus Sulfotelmatobacter sp.]